VDILSPHAYQMTYTTILFIYGKILPLSLRDTELILISV
jgi:hypothetical protein